MSSSEEREREREREREGERASCVCRNRVYDKELEVVQVSQGHTDTIQCIVHVPELDMVSRERERKRGSSEFPILLLPSSTCQQAGTRPCDCGRPTSPDMPPAGDYTHSNEKGSLNTESSFIPFVKDN